MGILTPDPKQSKHLNTSQQVRHAYGCSGPVLHVTPGISLLRAGDITKCPQCGASVADITDTPLGQAYLAFARPDLGPQQ